ncbi:MAG: protein phosphatase 2C domain-containing protein [Anaerolineae bacterium]|nr:protein phosphatase 2C domain-containing protein [Anaerolineae bacterium]
MNEKRGERVGLRLGRLARRLLAAAEETESLSSEDVAGRTEESDEMTSPQKSKNSGGPEKEGNEPEVKETRADEVPAPEERATEEETTPAARTHLPETAPLEPLPEKPPEMPLHQVVGRSLAPGGPPLYLRAARATAIGHVRTRNEDACLSFVAQSSGFEPTPPLGLFILADGMGGHFDGHFASQIVSRTVAEHVLRTLYLPLLRGDAGIARRPVQEVMEEAVQLANKALYLPDPDRQMGTTLTAALVIGSRLFMVHVGDSRAYLLHGDQLVQLTTDHTYVQALQDAGQLTAEEANNHPSRNLLYRALVGEELEQVDAFSRSLPEAGTLMLCSDGLWGLVSDAEMKAVLLAERSLKDKSDILVEKALDAGGHDNVSVVLVGFQA